MALVWSAHCADHPAHSASGNGHPGCPGGATNGLRSVMQWSAVIAPFSRVCSRSPCSRRHLFIPDGLSGHPGTLPRRSSPSVGTPRLRLEVIAARPAWSACRFLALAVCRREKSISLICFLHSVRRQGNRRAGRGLSGAWAPWGFGKARRGTNPLDQVASQPQRPVGQCPRGGPAWPSRSGSADRPPGAGQAAHQQPEPMGKTRYAFVRPTGHVRPAPFRNRTRRLRYEPGHLASPKGFADRDDPETCNVGRGRRCR